MTDGNKCSDSKSTRSYEMREGNVSNPVSNPIDYQNSNFLFFTISITWNLSTFASSQAVPNTL